MLNYEEYTTTLEEKIKEVTVRCFNCNVCYTKCPLNKSMEGFMINGPSGLIQAIFYAVKWDLFKNDDKEEILNLLFSCTTCSSCEIVCKEMSTGIPICEIIENGRKLLVDKGIGPISTQRGVLKAIYSKGNPYNFDPEDRVNWSENLKVKKIPTQKSSLLYYVGCSTSYDPELQNIARSIVKLFNLIGVDFGIFEREVCCSCAANRLGDEFLFDEMMRKNVEAFINNGIEKIVTTSPHCYNTFIKEYKGLNNIEVQHYTQFLRDWIIGNNNIKFKELNYTVTYHDPCYLGKRNGIYEEPRDLIRAIPGINLVEMEDNKKDSLCCGGGGGRMWAEIKEENKLANMRVKQAISVGAEIIIVACPWCYTMLKDAIKELGQEENIKVKDISELLLESLI